MPHAEDAGMPPEMLLLFLGVFGTLVALGIVYGICEIVSGVFIRRRRYRLFSQIVAIPRILFIPYGTILSLFTLIMLDRDTIKHQYTRAGENPS